MLSCSYNGWTDAPEDEREALDAYESAAHAPHSREGGFGDMSDDAPKPQRRFVPLPDRLSELCVAGKESAEYLWQVPHDDAMRAKVADLLRQIHVEVAKTGRREMARLVDELQRAAAASASPQQTELLQDGFDRLLRLSQASKSGLF